MEIAVYLIDSMVPIPRYTDTHTYKRKPTNSKYFTLFKNRPKQWVFWRRLFSIPTYINIFLFTYSFFFMKSYWNLIWNEQICFWNVPCHFYDKDNVHIPHLIIDISNGICIFNEVHNAFFCSFSCVLNTHTHALFVHMT